MYYARNIATNKGALSVRFQIQVTHLVIVVISRLDGVADWMMSIHVTLFPSQIC